MDSRRYNKYMGLDMYLKKRNYIGNNYRMPKKRIKIIMPKEEKTKIKNKKISHIIEEAGYWRKANHIHKWFVDNVQNGNDNCEEYYVKTEKMEKLRDICKKVLKDSKLIKGKIYNGSIFSKGKEIEEWIDGKIIENPTTAKKLLPTEKGFFFGSEDYDEYYLDEVKETLKIIEKALKNTEASYYYQSSW